MLHHDLFNRGQIIQIKINNNTISHSDIKELNDIDEAITLGCLNAEQSLKKVRESHPWSPTLATAILFVQLWNCVKTKLKTNSIDESRTTSIETRILSYNISQKNS